MSNIYQPIDEQSTFKSISLEDMYKELAEMNKREVSSVPEPAVVDVRSTPFERFLILDKAYADAEKRMLSFIVDLVKEKTNEGENEMKFTTILWYGAGGRAVYVTYNQKNDSVYVMLGNGLITYISEHGHFDNRRLALALLEEKYKIVKNERISGESIKHKTN